MTQKQILNIVFLFVILLLNAHTVFCQNKKDTSFLYRKISEDGYRAVYIEKPGSHLYNQISRSITIDTLNYESTIESLKDSAKRIIHFLRLRFPTEWYSLQQYKKKYYVYLPSESYFNTYLKLSDSTITLNYFNDGCVPALLKDVKWINHRTVRILTKSLYEEDSVVIFHFLNDSKTMAVLEFPMREDNRRFLLMIAKKDLINFPLIVNYCPDNRCPEWDFDRPNFRSLLK